MSLEAALQREGLEFPDLFQVSGLRRLDRRFLERLEACDRSVHARLLAYRDSDERLPPLELSELLLALAPHLEEFLAQLFGIEGALAAAGAATRSHNPVMEFKRQMVLRRARRYRQPITSSFGELDAWLSERLPTGAPWEDRELAVAQLAVAWLANEQAHTAEIERLTQWARLALIDPEGQAAVSGWVSFRLPQPVDHARLVPLQTLEDDLAGRKQGDPARFRRRDGFRLTDARMSARGVQDEVHYCIYCHDHDGDFCSKGFPEKKGRPELGLKQDPLGNTLTGCPLEEKISEMHTLKREGRTLAALAVAMVDNPMVPATGHRICNDCMKGCIYQKQDAVDIPQIETRTLTDVLDLPWGVEVYDLLTRWNPLRRRQYLPKPYNGSKVLIAGMGPAGFTMAHHLTMEGCAVVGVDGLKIEPLPQALIEGPVRDWKDLEEPLDTRANGGFGGVAEYGITVRWDKNFLKLIHLALLRRPTFQVFGGVRLGGTVTLEDAWRLGFHHVCVATGTGLPRVIPIGNSLARGMRQASDFLMALQLTGAAKAESLANLQVRLPALVIGGGLTAVDTATEVQAYYVKQVEKILARYERLVEVSGEEKVRAGMGEEDGAILADFLEHGRAVRAERERAAAAGETPDFLPLLRAWGGVTLVYRRGMNQSPAYLRNHEEIIKALEEGIYYAEGLDPIHAELDRHEHVSALVCRRMRQTEGRWLATTEEVTLPARAIFVAAGAAPNTIYAQEHPGSLELEADHFLPHVLHREGLQPVAVAEHAKAEEFGALSSYAQGDRHVSFIGDTNPVFHGSVVKAIASALRSYPQVLGALALIAPEQRRTEGYAEFRARLDDLLRPRVIEVRRDHPAVVELTVRAPMAARNFRPGQFYRLQTFENLSPTVDGTLLQIPLMTVSGAGGDAESVRLMLLQGPGAPRLAGALQPGDPLVLMGPTGEATPITEGKTVLVVAGQWGAAVMLALGPALRAAGNRVLWIASFRSPADLYHREELEAAADRIVWCTPAAPAIEPHRPQDIGVVAGDVIELLERYGEGVYGGGAPGDIPLADVDWMLVMGSTGLLRGLQQALRGRLQRYFRPALEVIGTVGSPMQCMLKGVCAQCLQWQIDPETGKRTRPVFSCAMQDQPLFWIDIDNLIARQQQNRLPDRLTALWIEHLIASESERVKE
jgi:NADPH-dependent glutamate synthase beta subunit-like oxidoreductase/NAD(P)H-flavin reductase